MILWQLLISLLFVISAICASEFDVKTKSMEMMTAVPVAVVEKLEDDDYKMIKGPVETMKLTVKTVESLWPDNEDEQILAFSEILNFISLICEKALIHEDKRTFVNNWIGGIFELAQETYTKQVYDADGEFDRATLKNEDEFDNNTFLKHQSYQDILFSSSSEEADSSEKVETVISTDYSEAFEYFDDEINLYGLIKSKMIREEEEEENNWQSDNTSVYSDCKEEIVEHKPSGYSDTEGEEKDGQIVVRESLTLIKGKARRRRTKPIGMMENILTVENLNMAADLMATSTMITDDKEVEGKYEVNEQISISGVPSGIDTSALMEQMQQQVMQQIMAQLAQSNPQLAQYGAIMQDERAKFEAAMDPDGDGLPEITKEGVVQYLKTSAIPKLLNSAIKGKTGIDVLRTLSMVLRSLHEGLGIVEVILKMLLRVTKAVRYYSLCMADIVNEMAREDNLTPIVDLSVPMDTIPKRKKKSGGKMKKLTSMILKKCKSSGSNEDDPEFEMSPFTMGIHAALSKTRDFTSELQKLPSILLLRLIHTIFAELDKRNGIIRVALAGKQHKTLLGMQDDINSAVEHIFEAILAKDEEAYNHLNNITPMMITEILISLISPVQMDPAVIEKHIVEVTKWIKPLMVFMNQESQINMLNYLLTDPEVESSFRKCQGVPDDKTVTVKKFHWTSSKRLMQKK